MNVAVAILRLQEGLDCTEILADIDDFILNKTATGNTESFDSVADQCNSSTSTLNSNLSPFPTTSPTGSNEQLICGLSSQKDIFLVFLNLPVSPMSSVESVDESESRADTEGRGAVMLGVTKNKQSKKKKKQAITFRYS